MRRNFMAGAIVSACLALTISVSFATPFSNGGFESGALAPWVNARTFSNGTAWDVTNTVSHSGSFSATDTGNKEIRQNFDPIAVANIISLSFWAMHASANVTALAFDLFYTDGSDNEFLVNTTGTAWNFFDVTSFLAPGKLLNGFSVFGNSGGCPDACARTWLDDVALISRGTVPEPTTLALLGIGLVGLALKRRRV